MPESLLRTAVQSTDFEYPDTGAVAGRIGQISQHRLDPQMVNAKSVPEGPDTWPQNHEIARCRLCQMAAVYSLTLDQDASSPVTTAPFQKSPGTPAFPLTVISRPPAMPLSVIPIRRTTAQAH